VIEFLFDLLGYEREQVNVSEIKKQVMVRYKLKSERVEENVQFVEQIFAKLAAQQPGGLEYSSMRLEDGVTFVHIARIRTDDGSNPLVELEEFKAFTAELSERCEEPPVAQEIELIGNYQLFN